MIEVFTPPSTLSMCIDAMICIGTGIGIGLVISVVIGTAWHYGEKYLKKL